MARKYFLAFPVFVVVGLIAFVNAQDPTRRLTLDGPSAPGILPVAGEETEISQTRSILRNRASQRAGSISERTSDRLQPVRKSAGGPGEPPSEFTIDAGQPLEPAPVATPLSAGDAAGEVPSVLKRKITKSSTPTPSATGAEPTTETFNTVPGSSRRMASLPAATPTVPPTENMTRPREEVPTAQAPSMASGPSVQTFQQVAKAPKKSVNALLGGSAPSLRVEMSGPRALVVNKPDAYSVTIVNDGEIAAADVQVRIALPTWAAIAATSTTSGNARVVEEGGVPGRFVWTIDQLEPRSPQQMQLQIAAKESRPVEMQVDWSARPTLAAAQIEVLQPQLEMTIAGSKDALYGENLTYIITLANPGNGDAENVQVKLTAGQGAPELIQVGQIPAGQQKQIEVQLMANQAGIMRLRAEASGEGNLASEISEQVTVRRANLQIAMTGPKLLFAGADGGYQFRVANTGNATAEEVVATISLPTGTNVTALTDGGKQTVNGVSWRIGTLNPNTERTFEIRCELTAAGDNQIVVQAQGAGDLSAKEATLTHVEALADLKLTVNEPKGPRPLTEEVFYELTIVNRGTKAAEQVQAIVHFSEGLEPIATDGAQADLMPGQAAFKPIARIDAGQQVVLKVKAHADRPGNHRFRAEVNCADPETRLLSEGTTRFFGEDGARAPRAAAPAAAVAPAHNVVPASVADRTNLPIGSGSAIGGSSKKR